MNCRETETLLLAERDGALTSTQRTELDRHTAGCAKCRRFQASLEEALGAFHAETKAIPVPDTDAEWSRLRASVKAGQRQAAPAARERKVAPLVWFTGPLAAAAAIALVFVFGRPTPVSNETKPSDLSPLAGLAQASYVEVADKDATPIVYVDQESGWLVVWADLSADNSHG